MAKRQKHIVFSRNLIHQLLLRRIDVGEKDLCFSFAEQLMRFSLREFHLATGLPCVVEEEEKEDNTSGTTKKKDHWMKKNQTLNNLVDMLVKNGKRFTADQKIRLVATILAEGILIAKNPVTKIPEENLLRARNFKEYCSYPWGNLAFNALRDEVKNIKADVLERDQYGMPGFIYAIQLWALSSVHQLGTMFGEKDNDIQYPLCLQWIRTRSPTMDELTKVDGNRKAVVKCIIGNPELHNNLVEDLDVEFGRVFSLVKRGYRLKRQDWRKGAINVAVC